ncbi:hypothetical protein R3P38DRAFT_2899548 [Favolaschia claudopus]|uniref:Uncharacterized protein n=1 Tax=Favolaschia claudopus TaxID=2862362 RepID=A0AAW0CJX8_9AGAR
MLSSKKRKNRPGKPSRTLSDPVDTPPDPALFIQAYEADIIRGPQAKQAADSLDFIHQLSSQAGGNTGPSGLIQWNPSNLDAAPAFPSDADDDSFASSSQPKPVNKAVWVDRYGLISCSSMTYSIDEFTALFWFAFRRVITRSLRCRSTRVKYDARLLLDSLPAFKPSAAVTASPPSPSGWSDLPSDTEDTFFFTPREAEDYRQQKRRRIMEEAREERLKARKAEDGEEEEEIWGGSDEEPDEAQRTLMERTATSVISSGNPAQLEMRILANYGTDKRFAFLRGRWKVAWATMKRKAAQKSREEEAKPPESAAGLGNLADYGDSSDEGGEENEDSKDDAEAAESAARAARQARAKAWAESRRAAKSISSLES